MVTVPSETVTTEPTTETTTPTQETENDDHQHVYNSLVTEPGCTEGGFTTYTCECGDTYTDGVTDAVGHQWGQWVTTQEPTTTTDGQAQRKCDVCAATESKVLNKVPAEHTHSYTSKVTKEPTCKAAGVKTYQCACGDSYTESIKTIAHKYSTQVVKPTCYIAGYTQYTCSGCGKTYTDDGVPPEHSFGPWQVDSQTTDYSVLVRKCTVCGSEDWKYDYSQGMPQAEILQDVLRLVNIEREKAGVAPLKYCYAAQEAADIRAEEIMTKFSHTRPDGSQCFTVFEECNFTGYYGAGENIAMGYPSTEAVMKGWMNSEGHRMNILSTSYTHIVIGYKDNHWVQLFLNIPD